MRSSFWVVGVFGCVAVACSSGGGASSGGTTGGPDSGATADGGASSSSGGVVGPDGGLVGGAGALPATTFLFVSKLSPDKDVLMAYDGAAGQTRVVSDLRGDGSEGWTIAGYSLSNDRTRIVLASNFGPTKEDNDTKLATRRIWSLAPDGSDFRRLTPVFPNSGGGKSQFVIEIRDPFFSRDGSSVLFNYGEFWYEGTTLKGGSGIWSVGTGGGALPSLFKAPSPCSLVDPSVDPSTGKVTITHSVCIPGQGQQDGIYLYAADGSGAPELLVPRSAEVEPTLETPRWAADGSGFVFIGTKVVDIGGTNTVVRGLFIFDMVTRKVTPVVVPEAANVSVTDAAAAPDASAIVYCLREGEATNLHLIDLTKDPATDTPLTTDGKSCHPVW